MSDTEREGLSSPSDLREQIEYALFEELEADGLIFSGADVLLRKMSSRVLSLPALRECVSLPTVSDEEIAREAKAYGRTFKAGRKWDKVTAYATEEFAAGLRWMRARLTDGLAQKETEKR